LPANQIAARQDAGRPVLNVVPARHQAGDWGSRVRISVLRLIKSNS
jgi:hypothetical protein